MPSSISRFRLNPKGFDQFRRSQPIRDLLYLSGTNIAEAAGGQTDFHVIETQNKSRARVLVITATNTARLAEAKHRALTRALDAGRI